MFRLGGREACQRYAGSFPTKREALARRHGWSASSRACASRTSARSNTSPRVRRRSAKPPNVGEHLASTSPRGRACCTGSHSDASCRYSETTGRRAERRRRQRDDRRADEGRPQARDDSQVGQVPRRGARGRAGVDPEPGAPPPHSPAARRADRHRAADHRARRNRLPAAAHRPTGCRCSGSTGPAHALASVETILVGDYDEQEPTRAPAGQDDEDAHGALGRPTRRARRGDRSDAVAARGPQLGRAALHRASVPTDSALRSRGHAEPPASRPSRRTTSATAASRSSTGRDAAGQEIGALRRTAEALHYRGHLHARAHRRPRGRFAGLLERDR